MDRKRGPWSRRTSEGYGTAVDRTAASCVFQIEVSGGNAPDVSATRASWPALLVGCFAMPSASKRKHHASRRKSVVDFMTR